MRIIALIVLALSFLTQKSFSTRFSLVQADRNLKKSLILSEHSSLFSHNLLLLREYEPILILGQELLDNKQEDPPSRLERLTLTITEKKFFGGIAQIFSDSIRVSDARMGATLQMNLNSKKFQLRYKFYF